MPPISPAYLYPLYRRGKYHPKGVISLAQCAVHREAMGDKHIFRRAHQLLIQIDICIGIQALKYQCCAFLEGIYRKMSGIDPVFIFDPLYLLSRIPPINIPGKLTDFHQIRMDTAWHRRRKGAAIAAAHTLPGTV